MEITAQMVKQLRDRTGLGIMECKTALQETDGKLDDAVVVLRKRGLKFAEKREGRATGEGIIEGYVHAGGRIAVLVEVNCESDFVAKNAEFQALAHDIAMHVAANNPRFVSKDQVTGDILQREREIIEEQLKNSGKPADKIPQIAEGKLQSFYSDVCLLEQPFVKDPSQKVRDLVAACVQKFGENITVRRFLRWRLGEEV